MGRVWMCSSFCGCLDIKQKLGSLNGDLIHAYFLIGDFHPTKQLIHGCILFSLCLLFLLTWLLRLTGVIL